MDQFVRRRAFKELAEFLESGSISYLSLNAGPSDIASLGYAKNFLNTLRECNIDPNSVLIEILETAVMGESQTARDKLAELSAVGIKIAEEKILAKKLRFDSLQWFFISLPIGIDGLKKTISLPLENSPAIERLRV